MSICYVTTNEIQSNFTCAAKGLKIYYISLAAVIFSCVKVSNVTFTWTTCEDAFFLLQKPICVYMINGLIMYCLLEEQENASVV